MSHSNKHKSCKNFAKHQIDKAIHKAYTELASKPECANIFYRLLLKVQISTDLIKPSKGERPLWNDACLFIRGLRNLAYHHDNFLRPIENWTPLESNGQKAFASLVHHLINQYPTPFFMNSAWLREMNGSILQQQTWYINTARGGSIRKLDIPLLLTRKMEHIFLQAPDHFTIEEAMRYSQVLGMGGDKNLAKTILATRLGMNLDNDDFWKNLIQIFINTRKLNIKDVTPIVDFLYHSKFARREIHTNTGIVLLDPPRPDFSLRGRSFQSLMRLTEAWHKELSIARNEADYKWSKSIFHDFHYLEESQSQDEPRRIWNISELLSSADLAVEGKTMHHCVRSYASDCHRGKTTIWSMTREVDGSRKRVLTIEVNPVTRVIRQARAKCNTVPAKRPVEIMRKWAKKEGLILADLL